MIFRTTEHVVRTDRHRTFYLACGVEAAPLIVFVHGWPELSISWRHQLPCFADLGFRTVAPDMRGYGRSSVYPRHEDYALAHIVTDMIELLDALHRDKAIWVGHDWGSPVVWSVASHHPERCLGVASLCVPYLAKGFAVETLLPLVDRAVYPEAQYPAGQWEYQLFYEESFDKARATFEANVRNTVKTLFRKGNPGGKGKPSRTALARRDGGWFGGTGQAPDVPMDGDVLTEEDLLKYVAALEANGFFGPDSWYMNAHATWSMRPDRGTAASCRCRCCSCTDGTTTRARPSSPAWRSPCGGIAGISPKSSSPPGTGWRRRSPSP